MPIRMETMTELPEIKSEINAEDFGGGHANASVTVSQPPGTPQPQQQQQQQQQQQSQQQNNCQWVGHPVRYCLGQTIEFLPEGDVGAFL